MKAFSIDNDNGVTAFASTAAAKKSGSTVFTTRDAFAELAAEWPMARLVELWNAMTGVTPVKKFKDRGTAVTRIWNALQTLEPAPEPETNKAGTKSSENGEEAVSGTARDGSKRARILELMRQAGGVTLDAIMTETGWRKHTVRGFVSGSLVKKGVAVESFKREDGQRAYRIPA